MGFEGPSTCQRGALYLVWGIAMLAEMGLLDGKVAIITGAAKGQGAGRGGIEVEAGNLKQVQES